MRSTLAALLGGTLSLMIGGAFGVEARSRGKPDIITVETDAGFCMGQCDWYRMTVKPARAKIEVYHNDTMISRRSLRLAPAEYEAFRNRLAPYRPIGDRFLGDPEQCDGLATDMGGYHVAWIDGGPPARLMLNDGCSGKQFVPMREALAGAAASLGFKKLPGASSGVVASTVIGRPGNEH